jgi:hypothetical protein
MSEFKPTKKQADEALAFLSHEIDAPAYFTRLAELGIQPRNEQEAEDMFKIGLALEGTQTAQTKESADRNPFLAEALRRLDPTSDVPQAELDKYAKAAAEQLPLAKAAALVYSHIVRGGELAEDEVEE